MWNIFDQLEMYMKNSNDNVLIEMAHHGVLEIEHAPF